MSDNPTAGTTSLAGDGTPTATSATLAGFSATGEGGIPISLVRDTAVLKEGTVSADTSAFQTPQQIQINLAALEPAAAQQFVASLVPQPLPPPPESIVRSLKALDPRVKRFHGVQVPMFWFPGPLLRSPCADMFGYMFSATVRTASRLPFDAVHQALLTQLGSMMADPARDTGTDSTVPAGYTYFGQFVDHDITLDVTSTIDKATDANTIPNMRRPALDLDSVYGRGPALDPYLYTFPTAPGVPATAVKFQLGRNRNQGPGGPLTAAATTATPTSFDVPRVLSGTDTAVNAPASTFTAIIGDPRNDENVIVAQLHHAMLKFHNRVVDLLLLAAFPGDVFAEAKRIVTHHYQWCVVHDFLPRVCGAAAVNNAIATVVAPVGSAFRMPVEFSVAAYRFGHSMIRNGYVLNSSLPPSASTLKGIFDFIRVPLLPLFSNWATDFNMFFNTAHPVAGKFNNARRIDSLLAAGLEGIPGGSGIMAILAARNLRRGLAFGLPSGQAAAGALGIPVLTPAQLKAGLLPDEIALLNSNGGVLLTKTPLWYYVLREARVLAAGNRLGPLGGRIVAETFVRLLKRDADSFMNVPGFTPSLPSSVPGTFMIADLLEFAGVLQQ
ncbi:MAG TPA: heme peroxidase family protein [Longimicrobium sp.]